MQKQACNITQETELPFRIGLATILPISRRHPLQIQRARAKEIELMLDTNQSAAALHLQNRSHSRGLIAVARSDNNGMSRFGIDVEYADPSRPWQKIIASFGVDQKHTTLTPYVRGWTFIEAYYKAFQHYPDAELIDLSLNTSDDGAVVILTPGECCWFQMEIQESFHLSAVWVGDVIAPELHWLEQDDTAQ